MSDVAEIARLNGQLGRRLSESFTQEKVREVTYPAGHQTRTVYFEPGTGASVRAWSPDISRGKFVNFLLAGDPSATTWMQIDVQINFPADTYSRRMAGVFVKDEDGDVLIAHRGKLTKGKAGLPKEKVFREFASRTVDADDQRQTSKVILISAMDDPDLAGRLWQFAVEAREVATRIASKEDGDDSSNEPIGRNHGRLGVGGKRKTSVENPILKLRSYFDEYAGEGNSKGYGGGKRTVEHGHIVKALELQMRGTGTSLKAQAIDLAIVATRTYLFEVKTSARSTDVYTGVGQLVIHGECIKDLLVLPVRRYLVLPCFPNPEYQKHLNKRYGINIVTYKRVGISYKFSGLVRDFERHTE